MDDNPDADRGGLDQFREELKATVSAYRGEGPNESPLLEEALLEHFMQRVEAEIDARVDARVNARIDAWTASRLGLLVAERVDSRVDSRFDSRVQDLKRQAASPRWTSVIVVAVSMIAGLPLTAIAGGTAGTPGLILIFALILGINVAVNVRR